MPTLLPSQWRPVPAADHW